MEGCKWERGGQRKRTTDVSRLEAESLPFESVLYIGQLTKKSEMKGLTVMIRDHVCIWEL